ncbi:hypothetical protein [Streptomyces sp. NBC_00525]|uniref:hypothetical protein n=1 Tax=Streptomyces sp. NBC_00525 TaxID=2903660 RepID=UPI002E820EAB|nr:hypothetical protein [Streptomyces sp. NBC_00525]WUC95063.1 hypothetical protein OG710_16380 [Streptomyces sp. NBC_00525]
MQRFVGAVGTVAVAALVNVATGFLTDHRSTAWWVSAAVLLVVGTAVQWWLPVTSEPDRSQRADDNQVDGNFTQASSGPTAQEAHRNRVKGDFGQHQNG